MGVEWMGQQSGGHCLLTFGFKDEVVEHQT